jgi:APA family basic amino acid/polyamine antiporter
VVPALDGWNVLPGISAERALAILLITALTFGNARGVEVGKRNQTAFTIVKVATLVGLIGLCFGLGFSPSVAAANFTAPLTRPAGAMPLAAAIGSAMVGALFSSDAWNNLTFAAEEVRDPERTIRRALVAGTTLVVVLYLAATLAYLVVLPGFGTPDGSGPLARGIAHADHDRVGSAVMEVLVGPTGAIAMALAIMVSTFGCVNGLVLSGARVSYAMARDGLFFGAAGTLSTAGTPTVALVLQGLWASILTLTGTYGDLLDYVIFAALLFYALTVAATLRVGARGGGARRAVAIGYVVVAAAVMLDLLIVKPRFTWPGLAIVASGVPVYALWRRQPSVVS